MHAREEPTGGERGGTVGTRRRVVYGAKLCVLKRRLELLGGTRHLASDGAPAFADSQTRQSREAKSRPQGFENLSEYQPIRKKEIRQLPSRQLYRRRDLPPGIKRPSPRALTRAQNTQKLNSSALPRSHLTNN